MKYLAEDDPEVARIIRDEESRVETMLESVGVIVYRNVIPGDFIDLIFSIRYFSLSFFQPI